MGLNRDKLKNNDYSYLMIKENIRKDIKIETKEVDEYVICDELSIVNKDDEGTLHIDNCGNVDIYGTYINKSEDKDIGENEISHEESENIIEEEKEEIKFGYVAEFQGIEITEDMLVDGVICISTNKIYDNNKDASEKTGVNATSIKKCCNGNAKSAGKDEDGNKLEWMYLKDFIEKQ